MFNIITYFSSDRSNNGPPPTTPVFIRCDGGRRRSSSLDPKAYDNLSSSPHHFSTYDNISDNSSDEGTV